MKKIDQQDLRDYGVSIENGDEDFYKELRDGRWIAARTFSGQYTAAEINACMRDIANVQAYLDGAALHTCDACGKRAALTDECFCPTCKATVREGV